MPIHRTYGWAPDLPDHRDHTYSAETDVLMTLPPKKDLRRHFPPVYNQGQLGSCTANAIAGAIQFEQKKQGLRLVMPSRLFIYYNERAIERTIQSDNGAQIRNGIKTFAKVGACTEYEWPYVTHKFADKPHDLCYKSAGDCQGLSYQRLTPTNLNQLKACLSSGYPFVFGFTVYDAFEGEAVAKSGHLNLPRPKEKSVGGHAVLAVGYDDDTQRFLVRNSWAADWGLKGYFTMPYAYVTNPNLADDFWTIRLISGKPTKRAKKK